MSVFELQTGDSLAAFDGGFQQDPWTEPTDDFDKGGPNRFTIWIPTERVVVNMGNAVHGTYQGQETDQPAQIDAGFVAQTQHHLQLHTFGESGITAYPSLSDNTTPSQMTVATGRTVLRLGTPGQVVSAVPNDYGSQAQNSLKVPTQIGTAYPLPYTTWNGYAMITEGASWHESWGNNMIVSGNADVRVAGARSVLIGSPGDVHIMADQNTVGDIVGNSGDNGLSSTGKWSDESIPWKAFNTALGIVGAGLAWYNTYDSLGQMMYSRPAEEGSTGWKGFMQGDTSNQFNDAMGAIGALASPLISTITAIKSLKDIIKPDAGPSSSVTLYGASSVTAFGKVSATLHADAFATVSGLVSTSVGGGVVTSVSAVVSTSVSGLTSSMSGLLSVGMSSSMGSATVTGRTSAQISSWGKVFVAANDDVQLNSMENSAYVHGNTGFYVGCGAGDATPVPSKLLGIMPLTSGVKYTSGPGYGIVGDPIKGLFIGRMTYANTFKDPFPDERNLMSIAKDKIVIKYTNAKDDTKTVNLTLDDSGATISGKRICLC